MTNDDKTSTVLSESLVPGAALKSGKLSSQFAALPSLQFQCVFLPESQPLGGVID